MWSDIALLYDVIRVAGIQRILRTPIECTESLNQIGGWKTPTNRDEPIDDKCALRHHGGAYRFTIRIDQVCKLHPLGFGRLFSELKGCCNPHTLFAVRDEAGVGIFDEQIIVCINSYLKMGLPENLFQRLSADIVRIYDHGCSDIVPEPLRDTCPLGGVT